MASETKIEAAGGGAVTFDLQSARKHADTGGLMNTTKWLHAALDEIERLRYKLETHEPCGHNVCNYQVTQLYGQITAKDARIKELEVWLVDERAWRICHIPEDRVGHWPRYEPMLKDEARQQLQQEGKIGGRDHIVGANKLILTAKQRDAIRMLIEPVECLLVDHDAEPEIEDAVKVLRAMLDEATRE